MIISLVLLPLNFVGQKYVNFLKECCCFKLVQIGRVISTFHVRRFYFWLSVLSHQMFHSLFHKSKSSNIKIVFSKSESSNSFDFSHYHQFPNILEFLIDQFSLFLFDRFLFPMFSDFHFQCFLIFVFQFHTLIDYFPFGKSLCLSPNFLWLCTPVFQSRQCSRTHWDHDGSWCLGSWQGWGYHRQRLWCWSWLRGCLCNLSTVEKSRECPTLLEPPFDHTLLNPPHQQHQ